MEERAGVRRLLFSDAPLLNPRPTRSSWGEEENSSLFFDLNVKP
jgi:hypothetical protein